MVTEKNKLLNETYKSFMDQVLGLCEPDTLKDILLEDAMGFGTTINEKIYGVDAFLELIEIQNKQSEGLGFKWKTEPLSRYVSPNEGIAAFADDIHLNFEVNGEQIEMYLRISVILEFRDDKWLVIHWHGSKPEEVQSEEDTFGIETWKQKVETLEKLVAERTADLVGKNRELEVEASLERVRARTMAMQHSDELADASFLLDQQVRALGIKTWGCAFNIYGEKESTEWFSNEMGTLQTYKTPREKVFLDYYEAGQKGEILLINEFAGKECFDWYNYLCTLPGIGDGLLQMKAAGGSFPTRQIDHVAFFKYGYLLFISFEPVFEAHEIFIRFAQVFEQTYTRFLDLQKAEAQALKAEQDVLEIKIARQKAELALSNLKATQTQLIQSEKMASLGELTAGIAHEIQNPLNFVNNFSEVSIELIDELKEVFGIVKAQCIASGQELASPQIVLSNLEEVEAILHDLEGNQHKINQHGKRADAIVKGMLQHSRKSDGQKELTDINALCDEYLRLSYHGLRAKDNSFNATLKTDFDENIGNINIIPQDIGRVILNLLTNAFYAVSERKVSLHPSHNAYAYEPTVSISTKKLGNKIEITVSDNGNGIPQNIVNKIFQPFFTTKPTGQGTGLGLSLSYDIISKGHGGELKVETTEGAGTSFTIKI